MRAPRAPGQSRERPDDRRLVRLALDGEHEAFGELFERHSESVRRLLVSAIGPRGEIDDLAQDVFVQAFRSLGRFRGEARFSTWLHRIAVNVAVSYLRRLRRAIPAVDPARLERRAGIGRSTPEQRAEGREMLRRFNALLDGLTPKRRTALALFAVEGLSIAEVAELTGVAAPVAKSRIWFARRDLRRRAAEDPYLAPLVEEIAR